MDRNRKRACCNKPTSSSTGHKSTVRANLQAQFFPQRLALLQVLEELFEDAHHNCVDADSFGFCPFLELVAGFSADVEELRVGQLHAGLAGLHDVNFFALDMTQSKKDDPGQIALYA